MNAEPSRPAKARALISALAKRDLVEVRRVEIVARDFAAHVETIDRAPSVRELERWLESHAQVTELSASDDALNALLGEFLARPKPPPTEARNVELERAIYQDEHPERAISVYADWLQEHNDPFGEQLAIGLTGDPDRFSRYLRDHAEQILGEHWREYRHLTITWSNGFIDRLLDIVDSGFDHRPVDPRHWGALLRTRSCEMLRAIRLMRDYTDELDVAIEKYAPPGLMSLDIHVRGQTLPRMARRPFYHLSLNGIAYELTADSISPRLEQLELCAHDITVPEPFEHGLRRLHVHQVKSNHVRALERLHLPHLERLTASGDQSLFAHFPQFVATS